MASITSVTVLAPNGRRQVVKVTPNTTILQVLEEVCRKQGFKSEAFELRHQNRSLDLTAVIRFSGLPNLASLEMAEASKARTESAVGLVLQLESGKRVSGDFMPTATLWEVLTVLAPQDKTASASVVYLRREVSGHDALQRTTLRDLGLTGGRALLRLVPAATEGPRQQANVSAPLTRAATLDSKPTTGSEPMEVGTPHRQQAVPQRETDVVAAALEQQRQQAAAALEKERQQAAAALEKERQRAEAALERERTLAAAALERERQQAQAVLEQERRQQFAKEMQELEQQIVLVGPRDAVVFHAASSHSMYDEPDDFFETTVDDARVLYRDLKAAVANLEEAPLLTAAIRDRAPDPEPTPAVIRVQFPDRAVLQATFQPTETVADVLEFVRSHLVDSSASFTLFTTPPRVELAREATLRDVGCSGGCVLHFAPGPGTGVETGFLRTEALTSAAGAALLASRVRGVLPSAPAATNAPRPVPRASHAPSTSHGHSSGHSHASSSAPRAGHVPKWFKPA